MKPMLTALFLLLIISVSLMAVACGGNDPEDTTAPATAAPATSAAVTTAPVTAPAVTSAHVTSAAVTTAPVTSPAVTSAPVTTPAVTTPAATTAPVTTRDPVPVKTPAPIFVENFTGALDGYTVGYESGAEAAAEALGTALSLPVAAYDASVAKSLHLAIESEGFIPLGAGDYHIYVIGKTVHLRAGDADGLTAAVAAFLGTVEDGVSSHSAYLHTVYRATPPADVMTFNNYAGMTELIGTTVEDPLSYVAGDHIIFVLNLMTGADKTPTGCGSFTYRVEADDCKTVLTGTADGRYGVFAITAPVEMTLIPGTVRLSVDAFDANGGLLPSIYSGTAAQPNITSEIKRPNYSYIGGAFVDAANIVSDVSRTDEEFLDFWTARLKELRKIDPTLPVNEGSLYHNGFGIYQLDATRLTALGYTNLVELLDRYDFFEVYLRCDEDTVGGRPAVGYLSVPKNAKPGTLPIRIYLNAYGNRDGYLQTGGQSITLAMHPCGLPKGTFDENGNYRVTDWSIVRNYGKRVPEYDNPETGEYTKMFLRNIQMLHFLTNEEYYDYIEWADTNMESLDAFRTLHAAYNGKIIFNYGGSNGGFQNIATAALLTMTQTTAKTPVVNGELVSITVGCPSMCDAVAYAGRTGRFLSVQGGGIGQNGGDNIQNLNILNYALFDTVHFAKFIQEGKLIITAGFGDVTSPAAGIMALYNAATIEKEMTFTQNKDHSGKNPNTMVSVTVTAPAASTDE